jgi:preprotein translocase subunit SecY
MILGLFGQGIRAAAGLKKQADEAGVNKKALKEVFDPTTFWFSLFTGALAGMAAYLGLVYGGDGKALDLSKGTTVLGIVSAGYAGADFIESFAKKYLPGS